VLVSQLLNYRYWNPIIYNEIHFVNLTIVQGLARKSERGWMLKSMSIAKDCHGDFREFENLLLDKELGIFYKALLRVLYFSRVWRMFNENN
jgi:hypothetical protein